MKTRIIFYFSLGVLTANSIITSTWVARYYARVFPVYVALLVVFFLITIACCLVPLRGIMQEHFEFSEWGIFFVGISLLLFGVLGAITGWS